MAAEPALLEAERLGSGYGRIPILRGVTLSVGQGEVVGVVGHNGMGKSTLLRTLIGELRASSGAIRFDGLDVTQSSMAARARMGLGYVPQGRGIFPALSVLENLRMGSLLGPDEARFAQVLDQFPVLKRLLHRQGGSLSGGEQQMLALARCLVGAPRLILLDEPSEGIQPSIVEQIVEYLRQIRDRLGLSMLLVEQDLEVIAELGDRVIVMKKGEAAAEMAPAQLRDPAVVDEYLGL